MRLREGKYECAYSDTLKVRLRSTLLTIGFEVDWSL